MYSKLWFTLLAFVLLCSACTPSVENNPPFRSVDPHAVAKPNSSERSSPDPYTPAKSDQNMQPGNLRIDSLVILASNSFPPHYQLDVKGSLPSPCHQLRAIVADPNMKSEIRVKLYSLYDPYKVCTQVPGSFDASLSLGAYVRGSYTVLVNGEKVGEIVP